MNANKIKKILIPSPLELFICLLAAMAIVLTFHFNDVVHFISTSSALTSDEITNTYQQQLEKLDQFEVLRTLVLVVFWATVGLGAYVVYLVISQAVTSLRNEVVITTQFTNRGRFEMIILPILIHAILAIVFLLSLWLSYTVGLGFWLGLFEQLLYEAKWLTGISGFLGLMANLYLLWIEFQLVKSY